MISLDPVVNAMHMETEGWTLTDYRHAIIGCVLDWSAREKTIAGNADLEMSLLGYSLGMSQEFIRLEKCKGKLS